MITPIAINIIKLRRRRATGTLGVEVARMPCDVTSNTQARTSATGNPISNSAITTRITEFEISKTGRT